MKGKQPNSLRVLTWNIHACVGSDGRYDPDRILALIRKHDPDIIALQEMDSRGRSLEIPLLDFFKQALGEHSAEARTIAAPDGHYGHAIISRYPLRDVRLHDLTSFAREERFAIETNVAHDRGILHLVSTHLGLNMFERRRQARLLAELASKQADVSVMLGDFNDWFQDGVIRRTLAGIMPDRSRHKTFPACYPLFSLDRIYCRPNGRLLDSWTDTDAKFASDHLPVIADISIAANNRQDFSGDIA